MFTSQLDHLIWAVPDLDGGVADFAELAGATAVAGGRHPGVGTHNALLGLDQKRYFEIIAPDPSQDSGRGFGKWVRRVTAPTLLTWAARCDDIEAVARQARGAGLETTPVASMSRQRPDGSKLSWQILFLNGHDHGMLLPFFIQWHHGEHPCDGLAEAMSLTRFRLQSPAVEGLRRLLAALGLANIEIQSGSPSLIADLATPKGTITLQS